MSLEITRLAPDIASSPQHNTQSSGHEGTKELMYAKIIRLVVPLDRPNYACVLLLSPFCNPADPCGQWFVTQLSLMSLFFHPGLLLPPCVPLTSSSSLDRAGPVTHMRIMLRSRLYACALCYKAGYTHAHSAVT
jgi:hypothetical protein